jgi:GNAT superfamily N-acetyltransferase
MSRWREAHLASIRIGQPWRSDPTDLSLRPFAGTPDDLQALATIRNETLRVSTLPQDFREVNGDEMAAFYNRAGYNLADNAWLLYHRNAPVAAAVVYPRAIFPDRPPGNFDMYVVPEMRGHGLGSRLLAHLEQAAIGRGHRALETTIAREDSESTRFLLGHGFSTVGQWAHLARDNMQDLPQPAVPDRFSIRSLLDLQEAQDLYMETTNRLGAYDYNYSLVTPEEMAHVVGGDRWEPGGVLFLLEGTTRIVGVIRASAGPEMRGYLHEIRLEPASRGKGLGMAMLAAALRYLGDKGVQRAELDTTGENTPAHSLAIRAGFRVTRHWLHFLKPLRQPDSTEG